MVTGCLANILMYFGWSHGASLSYSTLNVHCPWDKSKQPGNWSLGSILCLVTGCVGSCIVIFLDLL